MAIKDNQLSNTSQSGCVWFYIRDETLVRVNVNTSVGPTVQEMNPIINKANILKFMIDNNNI